MRRVSVIILAAIAVAAALPTAGLADPAANPPRGQERTSPYMRVFSVTQAPYGFVQFCARMPEEKSTTAKPAGRSASRGRWKSSASRPRPSA